MLFEMLIIPKKTNLAFLGITWGCLVGRQGMVLIFAFWGLGSKMTKCQKSLLGS